MSKAIPVAVIRWLQTHYGVITHGRALNLGMTEPAIRRAVAAGTWVRPYRGVYVPASSPGTPLRDLAIAVAAAGRGAVASHRSAAWLWQLSGRPPERPEVTVAMDRNPRLEGVCCHRSVRPPEGQRHQGLPVTTPLRTLFDCAPLLDQADMIDRGLTGRLWTVASLHRAAQPQDRLRQPGRAQIARALASRGYIGGPSPSILESRMARLMHRYHLPVPEAEVVWGGEGEYRLDFAYRGSRLIVEVDGYAWHHTPDQQQRDHARRRALVQAGWTVLVYTWRDVTGQPDKVAAEIDATYRRLAQDPPG